MRATRGTVVTPDGARVRLAPGSHSSPREGVCVVELAALLASEEFGDRPRCVCPVIGAFLRGLNDRASHTERQRLIPYATRIVNTRGGPELTRKRRDICLEWAGARLRREPLRRLWTMLSMRVRIAVYCGAGAALRLEEGAGDYAARIAISRADTDRALELLEALLAAGGAAPSQTTGAESNGNGGGNGHRAPPSLDATITVNGDRSASGNGARANGRRSRVKVG